MKGRLISRLHHGGKLDLRLLGSLFQALERHAVFAQIDALVLLELVSNPVDDALIEIIAAEVRIAIGRFHFENAIAQFEDRDIEGAATQVEHRDQLVFLLVQTIRPVRKRLAR